MHFINLYPGSFGSNCYLLIDGTHAVVIDPSAAHKEIEQESAEYGAKIDAILLTHGHFDHILSLDTLRESLNIPAYIHKNDAEMLDDGNKNAFYTFFRRDRRYKPAEKLLDGGETLEFGDMKIDVIHTPGHSRGSVCYLVRSENIIFTGDTVFSDSYGRCDLWGGNISVLRNSLVTLQGVAAQYPGIIAYPGHNDERKLADALEIIKYM